MSIETATRITVAGRALTKIGARRLTDFTDEEAHGPMLQSVVNEMIDVVLADREWPCAQARQSLAVNAVNLTPWTYAYQLPVDPWCITPLELLDEDYAAPPKPLPAYPFKREGRILYSDLPGAILRYTPRVTNLTEMDPSFLEALACRVAWEICYRITESSSLTETKRQEYFFALTYNGGDGVRQETTAEDGGSDGSITSAGRS